MSVLWCFPSTAAALYSRFFSFFWLRMTAVDVPPVDEMDLTPNCIPTCRAGRGRMLLDHADEDLWHVGRQQNKTQKGMGP